MEGHVTEDAAVLEILEEFQRYESAKADWSFTAQKNREYRFGRQLTQEDLDEYELVGRSPAIDNRIHPAVEMGKALLTANRPTFKALPRGQGDSAHSDAVTGLLEYCWDISHGSMHFRKIVDDLYCAGAGFGHIWQNPYADEGKGEVYFGNLDPDDVFVDPNSRDPLFDDAEKIIIRRRYTKNQLKPILQAFKRLLEDPKTMDVYGKGYTTTDLPSDEFTFFPGDIEGFTGLDPNNEKTTMFRVYAREEVDILDLHHKWDGHEYSLLGRQIEEQLNKQIWMINDVPVIDAGYAKVLVEELQQVYDQQVQAAQQQGGQPPVPPTIEEGTYRDLLGVHVMPVYRKDYKIRETVIVGTKMIYTRMMNTDKYPVVPFMTMHTRTPYPVAEVSLARPLQDWINTLQSLILAHAQQATSLKVLLNRGSVDMNEFERRWKTPGVGIDIEMDDAANRPIVVQPAALPNELFVAQREARSSIDHQFGLYRLMMGDSSVAPETNSATLNIDQFGQRKSRSKLADLEESLSRSAYVALRLMQDLFKSEKLFRVINHNNNETQYAINTGLVDEKAENIVAIQALDTIKYDIRIVPGSTMPSNYEAQMERHAMLFDKGLLDKREVWKNSPLYDAEGLAKRFGEYEMMQQEIQGLQEELKKVKGDLQTREREAAHARDRVELEKTKSKLGQIESTAQAAATVASQRMTDKVSQVAETVGRFEREAASKDKAGAKK